MIRIIFILCAILIAQCDRKEYFLAKNERQFKEVKKIIKFMKYEIVSIDTTAEGEFLIRYSKEK